MLDLYNAGHYWRVSYISESPPAAQCVEEWRKTFASFSSLPLKMQLSVAILRMANDGEQIKDIGRRVSATTFWIKDTPELLEALK